ncbi:MAG: M20/M25/M40 family metallo-hydrolase [Acidobacteria bacterium]|nr:M20/M25/M40 family metallo-hydrolase [Acidobacteriota bacterium]
MLRTFVLLLAAIPLVGQPLAIDSSRLRAHIRFLSSDLLEGRAPGTRGGDLTEQYLSSAFEAAGTKVQLQKVPLLGVRTDPGSSVIISGTELVWNTDFVASSRSQKALSLIQADLLFVGYGNNYGNVDPKGKIVVMINGQGGTTAKRELATRLGAVGTLLLSKTSLPRSAAESIQLKRDPASSSLDFTGAITEAAALRLGWPVADLLAKATATDFTPVPIAGTLQMILQSTIRNFSAHNVVATIPGSDPATSSEHILYSAHWDHLGLAANGEDRIFNGAVDNATGCAALIEIARAWAALEPRPKRGAVFVATTGEESGLLGATYYAANPLQPLNQIRIGLNLDGLAPGPKPSGFFALGTENKNAQPLLEEAARRLGIPLRPDPKPELGYITRADHFPLMNAGVPAYSLMPLDESGQFASAYMNSRYHRVNDEYSPTWDMTSNEAMSRLALTIGLNAASRP